MSHDGGPLREVGAEPSRVIEMVVCVDNVSNRFVGNKPVHFLNHRERACLIERGLDHRDEIAELDGHAVVGPPCKQPYTVGDLLSLHSNGWCSCLSHYVRDRKHGDAHVRLHAGHLDLIDIVGWVQHRVSQVYMDQPWKLD